MRTALTPTYTRTVILKSSTNSSYFNANLVSTNTEFDERRGPLTSNVCQDTQKQTLRAPRQLQAKLVCVQRAC